MQLSLALATAVVETASAFLTSERLAPWHVDALSIEAAGNRIYCTFYIGQRRGSRAIALVKAPRVAHDEAPYAETRRKC